MLPRHQVRRRSPTPLNEPISPPHRAIGAYLDRPDVRERIGVDPSLTANFSSCSNDVGAAFSAADDEMFPTQFYVAALLERGVRALIYVGANDWICNWVRPLLTVSLDLTERGLYVGWE